MGGDEIILMEEEFPLFILYAFLPIKKILCGAEIDKNVVMSPSRDHPNSSFMARLDLIRVED